jgi:threonine 3-dehydrogenase
VRAIAKAHAGPGVEIVEVSEPTPGPGEVKIRLIAASVCGTDLHIYNWDSWAASRVVPPRIIGHEFCGTIVELGQGVTDRAVGDYVASESHIVCGHCVPCLHGQAHVCLNTRILGVDVDGGFAEYVVIPSANARPIPTSIPPTTAAYLDALGNAVHTALAGPLEGRTVLITGMGPIGLFAAAICQAVGASRVIATEPSAFRRDLAVKIGVDEIIDVSTANARERLREIAPGGVDVTLEMSGHPDSLRLAVDATRPGGRISLLGVYRDPEQPVAINDVIFKGLDVQGIVGRRLYQTWDQMTELLSSGKLNLEPVVTHQMPYTEFATAMELMKAGLAGKVVFTFPEA